jgi:hypothetical protein
MAKIYSNTIKVSITTGSGVGLVINNYSVSYSCDQSAISVSGIVAYNNYPVPNIEVDIGFCSQFDFSKNQFTGSYYTATTKVDGSFIIYIKTNTPPGGANCIVAMTQYSGQTAVAQQTVTIPQCGGGGGGTLPATFRVPGSFLFNFDISMLNWNYPYPALVSHQYYVGLFNSNDWCCCSQITGPVYIGDITGQIIDTVGNPVPNTSFILYLLTPDPNIEFEDTVTGNDIFNPSYNKPLTAKSDANGNIKIKVYYTAYPPPDTNSNNYPDAFYGGYLPLLGCIKGNTIPQIAAQDTIELQIPNTAVQVQVALTITWQKHYATYSTYNFPPAIQPIGSCLG